MVEELRFLWAYLRNPNAVSSVVPTASWNVEKICRTIPDNVRRVIVEYGPGTGVIANHLLREQRLTHDSILMMIEQDERLADALAKKWQSDPRAHVFTNSAENVKELVKSRGVDAVDHVITSIPFSKIPHEVVKQIIENTHTVLKPGGELTVFQVRMKSMHALQNHDGFEEPEIQRMIRNVPPLILARARKKEDVISEGTAI